MRIAGEFNIEDPIVITDSGANIKSAVHLAEWTRFPCAAHMINLAVRNGLDNEEVPEVKMLIDKCKSIVSFFKHSVKATSALKRAAEAEERQGLGIKATALVQEVLPLPFLHLCNSFFAPLGSFSCNYKLSTTCRVHSTHNKLICRYQLDGILATTCWKDFCSLEDQ